jgi:hypothetical protein
MVLWLVAWAAARWQARHHARLQDQPGPGNDAPVIGE